jgi:hypothetical protein
VVWRLFEVGPSERGLMFREGELVRVLGPARHYAWDPLFEVRVDVVAEGDVHARVPVGDRWVWVDRKGGL